MKSIALIHTVESVATTFAAKIKSAVSEELLIHNIWDDFLSTDANARGEFSIDNKNRLFHDFKSCELTGADLIVTTCSTLTPHVVQIRPLIKTPIIAIDDAMAIKAATYADKMLILATAQSTIEPTKNKIAYEAKVIGKTKFNPDTFVCSDAFVALKQMDMKTHDKLLLEKAKEFQGYDCIVLAQASMAHLTSQIAEICGCTVLNSPELCIEQIKQAMEAL